MFRQFGFAPARGGSMSAPLNRFALVVLAFAVVTGVAAFLLLTPTPAADAAGDVSVGTKGIVLAWDELSLSESSTTASEVMVRLGTQPTGNVTVALSGSADTNATSADCSGSGLKLCIDSDGVGNTQTNNSLTFTTSTWDTPQTFLVSALPDNSDKLDESITLTLTPSGGGYGSTEAATVAITIRDDDKNQFVFTGLTDSNRAIEVDEGTSTSSFTVALSANPDSDVTVALTSSNSMISVYPTSMTFTTTKGTAAQTVTITSGSDPNTEDETYYLRLKPSGSADTRTRGYSIAVTVDDADATNDLTVSETSLSLNESSTGNTDTFTVVLGTAPAAGKDVTVAIGVHGADGKRIATPDKNKLTFTSTTYSTAQTVTITGVVDRDSINESGTVRVTASQDGPFAGLSHEMTLTVTDNSSDLGINVFRNSQRLTEITTGPATLTAKVSLSAKPAANVTVTSSISPSGTLTARFGNSSSATFTADNWDAAQDLTIATGNNAGTDYTITLTATGSAEYASKTQAIKIWSAQSPTVNVHGLNPDNSFLVSFSRAAGSCADVTERICTGAVTQFSATTVVDVLELVVGTTELAVADDGTTSQDTGTPVPFAVSATYVNDQFSIRPTIPEGAIELNMLVKDRYWGVDGGVQGERTLKTIVLNEPGQATATLQRAGDATTWLTVRIDASKAKGEASNDWTLVPVQATANNQWLQVTVDDATKQLRVRFGSFRALRDIRTAINSFSGFTVVDYGGAGTFSWVHQDDDDVYSNIKFSGGFDMKEFEPPRTTNSPPTVANAIANQTVALKERIDVPLAGVFADADGDTLLYSASSSDTSVATAYLFGNSTLRLSGKALGTATITVTATDGRWADGLAPRKRVTVTDTFTVTVSDAPVSGNSPPPDNNDPNDPPYEPPVLIGLVLVGNSAPDFDGQTLAVKHVTDDSTACLDVSWGNAKNGQSVWTWECNNSNAQQWTFEKRTSGTYKDSYRLVSKLGNYCLDNRGDFTTSSRMGIWQCVDDNHSAAANQSVTVAASGEGYTLTFSNGSSSVWLTTGRASDDPEGSAGQTTVSGTAGANAIWRIASD